MSGAVYPWQHGRPTAQNLFGISVFMLQQAPLNQILLTRFRIAQLLVAGLLLLNISGAVAQNVDNYKRNPSEADWFVVSTMNGIERKDAQGNAYRLSLRTDHSTGASVWLIQRGQTSPAALLNDWNQIVKRDSDLMVSCRQRPEPRTISVGGKKIPVVLFFLEDEILGGPLGAMAGTLIKHRGTLTYLWVERYLSFVERLSEKDDRPTEEDATSVLRTLTQILEAAPQQISFTIETPSLEQNFCSGSTRR